MKDLDPQQDVAGSIPATLRRPGAAGFWLAVLLTGAGAGIAAAVLTRLLQFVQHLVWPGPDLLDAAANARAWRHVVVLLGAGLLTGAGQIVLHRLSSANGAARRRGRRLRWWEGLASI